MNPRSVTVVANRDIAGSRGCLVAASVSARSCGIETYIVCSINMTILAGRMLNGRYRKEYV